MQPSYYEKLGCIMRAILVVWLTGWGGFILYHLVMADKTASELAPFALGGILVPGIFWTLSGWYLRSGEK